jgi:hypothetical protein
MGKNIFYFIIAVVILAFVGGVVFLASTKQQQEPQLVPAPTSTQTPEQGLGSELSSNPGSKIPETNPLEGYKNPFE